MDLLQHRSRWGGAVHFALAATSVAAKTNDPAEETNTAVKSDLPTDDTNTVVKSDLPADDTNTVVKSDLNAAETNTVVKSVIPAGATDTAKRGLFGDHMKERVGGLMNSYIPTQSNNPAILKEASFENTWYAVAFPWQIDGSETPLDAVIKRKKTTHHGKATKPFATRLWGEPLVIYRDNEGELVSLLDVCPHRSAPLSMGKVEGGELTCIYHGWTFGAGGACTDVPTLHTVDANGDEIEQNNGKFLSRVSESNCGNHRAVVEHEGLVYIWRGNLLEADTSLLPSRRKGDMETVPIDTVLDYNVDYSYVVENNLDSPHLFSLHNGSVPPIESIGMLNKNLPKLRLKAFTDDCGMGHLGRLGENGRPKKLIRFDPPNVVRHGGVSGFEEEFHIIPIAPQRTRVLLRQHLPRGPILSTVTGVPGTLMFLTLLVNNWNYHIALEDACVMQGQASRIEDWGSPRLGVGGLGDDLIKRYWKWRNTAHENLRDQHGQDSPYYSEFSQKRSSMAMGIPTGTSFGDDPSLIDRVRSDARIRHTTLVTDNKETDPNTGNYIGTWGILTDYVQNTPAASFPPVNYQQYAKMLVFDKFVKGLVESSDNDLPQKMGPTEPDKTITNYPVPQVAVTAVVVVALLGSNPIYEAFAMMN